MPRPRDPLQLTVYELDESPAPAQAQRTRRGRWVMLMVLAACAAPVIASYLAFFVFKPQGRTNYGDLIQPTRALPVAEARELDGARVQLTSLKGQWLLVAVGSATCQAGCEQRLFMQRQLREMLGRDRDRLDKLWLITDDAALAPPLEAAIQAPPALRALRVAPTVVSGWLVPQAGRAVEEHLYLVDPMGEWMMRFPVDADPARVKRDLERLLRASASWDRAGR